LRVLGLELDLGNGYRIRQRVRVKNQREMGKDTTTNDKHNNIKQNNNNKNNDNNINNNSN